MFRSLRELVFRNRMYQAIPETEPVSRQQFALFRIFSFTGTLVCAAVASKMLLTISNAGALPFFIYALGLVMTINFYAVSQIHQLRKSYLIMLVAAVLLLHMVSYSCGGIRTAGTLYFGVIILYAYMLLGKKAGRWFTAAVIAHVTYLFIISTFTDWTSFGFFKNDVVLINEDFLVNAFMSFVLIAVQGNYLQSNKNEIIQDLEKKQNQLEEKNIELEDRNRLLNDYAHHLERTNSELRKFASLAAHDLKAPLRAIGSLSDFIADEEKGFQSENSKEFHKTIKGRVHRMDLLLDALMEHATVVENQKPVAFCPLKMLNIIASQHVSDKTEISISGNFPGLFLDVNLFVKTINILIENAIRFNDKNEVKIRISGSEISGSFELNIIDNGPGIDYRFHEKIFVIFQTLNARDAVEATGAGLAIAKKILESWNGSICLVNNNGEGAHFRLNIPCKHFSKEAIEDLKTESSFVNSLG